MWYTVVMMVVPPGEPTSREEPALGSRTIVGVIDDSIRFPGTIRLASPSTDPQTFGRPGTVEVVHLVVEQEPRPEP